jgi:hypothetical protein
MPFFSKLRGTFETLFQLGKGGPNLKNNAGIIEHRNNADAAFVIARALDPVAANDLVTLGYFNANNAAAQGVNVAKMPLLLATKVSTAAIPNSATVVATFLDITTAYDAGATWLIRRTGDAGKVLHGVADNDAAVIGTYDVPQALDWGVTGAGTVTATLAGVPTVGAAMIYIFYTTPTDIS